MPEDISLNTGKSMWYSSGMKIRFTRHATRKFAILRDHGVDVSAQQVEQTLRHPNKVDSVSRSPLIIAQGPFDARRVLRVVYKVEHDTMVVITFYPGTKSQYE